MASFIVNDYFEIKSNNAIMLIGEILSGSIHVGDYILSEDKKVAKIISVNNIDGMFNNSFKTSISLKIEKIVQIDISTLTSNVLLIE